MKKALLLSVFILLNISLIIAQVAINTDGSDPDPSGMLDIKSTTSGLLIPRMTSAQRDGIANPATGLMVFVTDDNKFYFNAGIPSSPSWLKVSEADNDWVVNGNEMYSVNTGNVGIGVASPLAKLQVNDGLLITGEYGFGDTMKINGNGTRMFFNPRRAAFRSGYVDDVNWNNDSLGEYSIASGYNTKASGYSSTALGRDSRALAYCSTALGGYTRSAADFSTALGFATVAEAFASTALGRSTLAQGSCSTAMGYYSKATASYSTAMGQWTKASGLNSTSLGYFTDAAGDYSMAMGNRSTALGQTSLAFGFKTIAKGAYSTVFGRYTQANGFSSVVIGMFNDTIVGAEVPLGNNTPLFIIGNGDNSSSLDNALVVQKDGLVGIGVNLPSFRIDLPNTTSAYGRGRANAWYTYSDKRLKTSQQSIDYGIKTIMRLNPKRYTQKSGSFVDGKLKLSKDNKNQDNTIGFIAQELYEIVPEAVYRPVDENSDFWSIDYEKLIPVLTSAIQEQQKMIDQLKEDIVKLQKEVTRK
jgi:hypothetical protein